MGELLPESMWLSVWIAGVMLFVMSLTDTLAYGVRTAGVFTRRLAISLSLFNAIVVFSRMGNLTQAPVLGTFSDGVDAGIYSVGNVLTALRIDLLFVVLGVVVGAIFMPTFVRLFERGIVVMEEKGGAPRTAWYAIRRMGRFPSYMNWPKYSHLTSYFQLKSIPYNFLIFNVLVTCFYSIGVMSTVLAASYDHTLANTCSNLSGIVNGIATVLLFIVVDPPSAIVIDQCISGKRNVDDAKRLNLHLVITRLAGTLLAILLLPYMGAYVLSVARWVSQTLTGGWLGAAIGS